MHAAAAALAALSGTAADAAAAAGGAVQEPAPLQPWRGLGQRRHRLGAPHQLEVGLAVWKQQWWG